MQTEKNQHFYRKFFKYISEKNTWIFKKKKKRSENSNLQWFLRIVTILISIEYIITFDLLLIYICLINNFWELHWELNDKSCVLITDSLIIFFILNLKIYQTHILSN